MAFGKRKNKKNSPDETTAPEETAALEETGQGPAPGEQDRAAETATPAAGDSAPEGAAASGDEQGREAAEDAPAEGVPDRATQGPFDVSERDEEGHYIDMGGLLVKPAPNVNIRIDVDQKRQNVVSVTFQHENSSLQVQAFAAPKSRGLWPEIRTELAESIRSQSGVVDVTDGPLGRQVTAKVPSALPNGGRGFKVARFVGVDGPRWFLRGMISGDAAVKEQAARPLEDVFRSLVVVRGGEPMAPRDLLPLRVPQDAVARDPEEGAGTGDPALDVPERGPETTQIG